MQQCAPDAARNARHTASCEQCALLHACLPAPQHSIPSSAPHAHICPCTCTCHCISHCTCTCTCILRQTHMPAVLATTLPVAITPVLLPRYRPPPRPARLKDRVTLAADRAQCCTCMPPPRVICWLAGSGDSTCACGRRRGEESYLVTGCKNTLGSSGLDKHAQCQRACLASAGHAQPGCLRLWLQLQSVDSLTANVST